MVQRCRKPRENPNPIEAQPVITHTYSGLGGKFFYDIYFCDWYIEWIKQQTPVGMDPADWGAWIEPSPPSPLFFATSAVSIIIIIIIITNC